MQVLWASVAEQRFQLPPGFSVRRQGLELRSWGQAMRWYSVGLDSIATYAVRKEKSKGQVRKVM